MIRLPYERGEYGTPRRVEALVKKAVSAHHRARRQPLRTAHAERPLLEFNFKPLDDGGLLGIYRDITELKEREEALAAAKEAAEAARTPPNGARRSRSGARRIERTRAIMQTVLDNMSDGVMLFDKDMRWQFTNRQLMDFRASRPEIAGPGVSAHDILRFQARRGDFGPIPESEIEAEVEKRLAIMAAARTTSGAPRAASSSSSPSSRSRTAACSRSIATSPSSRSARKRSRPRRKRPKPRARDVERHAPRCRPCSTT